MNYFQGLGSPAGREGVTTAYRVSDWTGLFVSWTRTEQDRAGQAVTWLPVCQPSLLHATRPSLSRKTEERILPTFG